jgi:hypothetical protein
VRAAALATLIVSVSCGPTSPSKTVTGNWTFTVAKNYVYSMSLTQSGDRISGSACVRPIGLVPDPAVREAPVMGDYPRLRFADPRRAGCIYDMKYEEDRDQIAGDCGAPFVRFNRGGSGRCD